MYSCYNYLVKVSLVSISLVRCHSTIRGIPTIIVTRKKEPEGITYKIRISLVCLTSRKAIKEMIFCQAVLARIWKRAELNKGWLTKTIWWTPTKPENTIKHLRIFKNQGVLKGALREIQPCQIRYHRLNLD